METPLFNRSEGSSSKCSLCKKNFGVFYSKKLCKVCMNDFCSDCTFKMNNLTIYEGNNRACVICTLVCSVPKLDTDQIARLPIKLIKNIFLAYGLPSHLYVEKDELIKVLKAKASFDQNSILNYRKEWNITQRTVKEWKNLLPQIYYSLQNSSNFQRRTEEESNREQSDNGFNLNNLFSEINSFFNVGNGGNNTQNNPNQSNYNFQQSGGQQEHQGNFDRFQPNNTNNRTSMNTPPYNMYSNHNFYPNNSFSYEQPSQNRPYMRRPETHEFSFQSNPPNHNVNVNINMNVNNNNTNNSSTTFTSASQGFSSSQPAPSAYPTTQDHSKTSTSSYKASSPPEPKKTIEDILKASDTEAEVKSLSVSNLKALLSENHIDYKNILEKKDLIAKVLLLANAAKQEKTEANLYENPQEHGLQEGFMNDENLCKICFELPINCVLLDCGHTIACLDCGKELLRVKNPCPICRADIVRVVRIFRA